MSGRLTIAVAKERRDDESRVAATPETVTKLVRAAQNVEVRVEAGAGAGAGIADAEYREAGARVVSDLNELLQGVNAQLVVRAPLEDDIRRLPSGAVLVGLLDPYRLNALIETYASASLTTFSLELLPRITRAQTMDVLSSQSNLAGYKAVLDAAAAFGRAIPMMMTAAGTVPPARVMVMGAGVAGLQAIATARRLGAIVSATDVRAAAREQVESLGAEFLSVDNTGDDEKAETEGGYAREMGEDYQRRQAELIAEEIKRQDIVICTALVPGRPAPRLISAAMVESMREGSIIFDLAAEQGGNCELSRAGERITAHGVTIIGDRNVPGELAASASALYARNLLAFVTSLIDDEGRLHFDWDDEILAATVLTRDGAVVHPRFEPGGGADAPAAAPSPASTPAPASPEPGSDSGSDAAPMAAQANQ